MKIRPLLSVLALLLVLLTACNNSSPDPQRPADESADVNFIALSALPYSSRIQLSWEAQPGNPTYRILRVAVDNLSVDPATAKYTSLGETKELTFDDKTVAALKTYYYKIQVRYSNGKVAESEYVPCLSLEPTEYDRALETYTKLGTTTGGQLYELSTPSVLASTIVKIVRDNIGNQPTDVVILLDNTGSMGEYIDDCRSGLNKIIDALPANTRLGAGGYRDHGDSYVLKYKDLTTNFTSIRTFLADMKASGGGDLREAVYDAVYGVLTQASWTNKKRIIIVVGDYPPQEDPNKTDHSYEEVVDKCRQTGVNVNLFPILIGRTGEEEGNG